MSGIMSWTVIIGTILSLLACFWLIVWTNRQRQSDEDIAESESHVWDEDVRELNNPLPMWWLYLFIITLVFSGVYLIYYPGLGNFAGVGDWSQEAQYEAGSGRRRGALRAALRPLRPDGFRRTRRTTPRHWALVKACMRITARSAMARRHAAHPASRTWWTASGCTAVRPNRSNNRS